MATYTSNIRLVKQDTGENDSTWGVVLNDGMISLTDVAIAGYTTISLAGGYLHPSKDLLVMVPFSIKDYRYHQLFCFQNSLEQPLMP